MNYLQTIFAIIIILIILVLSILIIKIFKDDKEHDLTITLFGIFKITIKKHR